MMVAAGEIKLSPYKPAKIDHADAILVDRAWRMMPQNPIRYWVAKNTLIAQYAYPQLSVRSFCDWVKRRKTMRFCSKLPVMRSSICWITKQAKSSLAFLTKISMIDDEKSVSL